MKTIEELVENKKKGVDCTEEESAEIKGFIREQYQKNRSPLWFDVVRLFHLEFSEVMSED